MLLCAEIDIITKPIQAALKRAEDIKIVATATDRVGAVSAIWRQPVDVVILDIGVGERATMMTLSRITKADAAVRLVMVASISFANIRTSMKGLMAGAAAFVPIPTQHSAHASRTAFQDELLGVLRALGPRRSDEREARRADRTNLAIGPKAKPAPTTRKASGTRPRILLIGSSTGGPQAVSDFLTGIGPRFPAPILITQHMPPVFTRVFATGLARKTGIDVCEAEDEMVVEAGRAYVAPGGLHMRLKLIGGAVRISLSDDPPINFCRPAVDPLFESAAEIYTGHVLAVVLTGMGQDGLRGAQKIVQMGGTVIAQDQATSVVWGMPGAVAKAGICAFVLPLPDIAARVKRFWGGAKD